MRFIDREEVARRLTYALWAYEYWGVGVFMSCPGEG
jgi:hypothetical protein